MLYSAKALLLAKNVVVKSHRGLISKFNEEFLKSNELPKELGKYIAKAYDKRILSRLRSNKGDHKKRG